MGALLELSGVEARYGARTALSGVSLALGAGEVVGLLGPNGAGKSTLLRIAAGVLAPRAGEVRLEGRAMPELDRPAIARRIAWLPQAQATELAFSAREIVELGRLPHLGPFRPPGPADRASVEAAIEATAIGPLLDRAFPDLSEGERQRVLLARCLAQDPAVLLLDEPTASLDVRHAWSLVRVVRARARAGVGVIAAIHDLALAARACDRVIVIAGGKVVCDGAPLHALTPELIAEVFGMRVRLERDEGGLAIAVLGAGA